jgi:osomolarity two-component system, sensor histidine kinase SLN1
VAGGLVEIPAKRDDTSPVLTRTIGDPSTGTEAVTPGTTEEPSPTRSNRTLPPVAGATDPPVRPSFVQLPAPQDFSQHSFAGMSVSSSSTMVPQMSTSTGTSPTMPPPSPGYEPGIKVLVVDDDPLTRKLMSRMLTRIGCKVSTAENGEIALEMILGLGTRNTPSSEDTGSAGLSSEGSLGARRASEGAEEYKYAVVFLDNQMPVLSGLETVGKLRELGRNDFVVGVTGREDLRYPLAGCELITLQAMRYCPTNKNTWRRA